MVGEPDDRQRGDRQAGVGGWQVQGGGEDQTDHQGVGYGRTPVVGLPVQPAGEAAGTCSPAATPPPPPSTRPTASASPATAPSTSAPDLNPMTERILITGATGHLGARVADLATHAGFSVTGTYLHTAGEHAHQQLDVRDAAAVLDLVRRVRPTAVIHTAAGRADWHVIADGAAHVAVAAATQGSRLVHVSSDAIFSGTEIEYHESAPPDPLYRYGAAKAAAETAIAAVDPTAALVRTSLILGHGRGQHETHTRDLITGHTHGALFTDMIRTPVHVDDPAAALLELATNDYRGILNVTGPDPISRYDLGVLIAHQQGLDPSAIPASTLADSGLRLAPDVRLITTRAATLLHTRLRGVHEFMNPTHDQQRRTTPAPAGSATPPR